MVHLISIDESSTEKQTIQIRGMSSTHWKAFKRLAGAYGVKNSELLKKLIEQELERASNEE
jgi:hypothetical protein